MERKRELTKILLAESFKELLIKGSFDKITIKMIRRESLDRLFIITFRISMK